MVSFFTARTCDTDLDSVREQRRACTAQSHTSFELDGRSGHAKLGRANRKSAGTLPPKPSSQPASCHHHLKTIDTAVIQHDILFRHAEDSAPARQNVFQDRFSPTRILPVEACDQRVGRSGMNGSKSPEAATASVEHNRSTNDEPVTTNGHRSPLARRSSSDAQSKDSAALSIERDGAGLGECRDTGINGQPATAREGNEDAESEAETLIDSPVKKEAERRANAVKAEKADGVMIGGLPVPQSDSDDAAGSPVEGREMDAVKADSGATAKDEPERMDVDNDEYDSRDSLSDVGSRGSLSDSPSRASSRSRALSERPDLARNDAESPNPRKRKHRASSVSLPNKRLSNEPTRRRLCGLHAEDNAAQGSQKRSPLSKLKSHRRTASTQSAFMDLTAESSNRKHRAVTQFPVREPKSAVTAKPGWDQSSISSESTSHGQAEQRRPQRGIGRSTSTPGRPPGREHKRHVNKYGFTRLAEACESGDMDLIREWREKDPDQLELAEFAGNTPLQIAALNGNAEVVEYLIDQGCRLDCANVDKDTPLIDAAENGHLDVVETLLKAGVDPLRQNLKGQQALDVVTDETDNATEIRATLRDAVERWNSDDAKQQRQEEEERRYRAGPSKELHFMARTYENLLKLVTINDRNGVREFLDARVPVDNAIIAAAARTGDQYLINMLLAEMTEKKAHQKPEKPMLSVLGTSHFEMVKSLTQLDQFNPLWRSRQGKTWPEIAEERNGSNWRQEKELLQRLYHEASNGLANRSSSPVFKRDSNKRHRVKRDSEGNSSEDEAVPKRKNGRRLMSRRDIRAASGKAPSDSSSEEASSEENTGTAKEKMKPPESPTTKRAEGRARTKSMSSQPAVELSPRLRSSLRGPADAAMPSLDEGPEDRVDTGHKARQLQAKFAVEQAQRLEAEREEADAAEAEVKRREEEHRAVEEAGRAEEARKEHEARRHREAREAEERKVQEARESAARREREAREAEQARKAEEERERKQAELDEQRRQREAQLSRAKHEQREGLLASLPPALSHVLDPTSDFGYEGPNARNILLRLFTPLQCVQFSNLSPELTRMQVWPGTELFALNVQAAALVGREGIELLFPAETPAFENSLAQRWTSALAEGRAKESLMWSMLGHSLSGHALQEGDVMIDEAMSFSDELDLLARRHADAAKAHRMLIESSAIQLRWVRLQDVMAHLHPVLKGAFIETRCDWHSPAYHKRVWKSAAARQADDFLDRVKQLWDESVSAQTWVDGAELRVKRRIARFESSDVLVVQEK